MLDPFSLLNSNYVNDFLKIVILIILVFYAIFAAIVVRQVNLMSQTLITSISPIVKAISLFNFGFSLGLIVLVIGIL